MKRASIVSLVFGAVLTAAALAPSGCGTGISDELFAGSGGSSGNGSPSSSTGTQTVASSTSGDPTTTSASGMTTSSTGDPTTSSTVASSSSASTGGGGVMVSCGEVTCPAGSEAACCWHNYDEPKVGACVQGDSGSDDCSTSTQSGARETRIECQTQAHCADGTTCCGTRQTVQGDTYYATVTCQAECTWPNITFCDDPGAQDPTCPTVNTQQGPVQTTCKQSQLLPPGYLVCGT